MIKNKFNNDLTVIEKNIRVLLESLGLNLSLSDTVDTPKRMAKMYSEIFSGMNQKDAPQITVFPNKERYSSMILMKNIPFYSICSHHIVPFFGVGHIAYLPDKLICGLSKLARVVEFFSKKPQMQERLTEEIAGYLEKKLAPKGVMIMLEARHLCMEMRGIEKYGAITVTSSTRGIFNSKKSQYKDEFLKNISGNGKICLL